MQRSLKLPQVQFINKIIQDVQQMTEVSHQQYMDMNVDVPAEIQCQNSASHQNTVKDAQMQRQVQMIQKMPREFPQKVQNMLVPGSSEAAVQSPGPVLETLSRRQTSLCSRQVQCCRSRAGELEMRETEKEHTKARTCFGAREGEKRA